MMNDSWVSLSDEIGTKFKGWFRHSHEQDGFYIDIHLFWLEPFDEFIELTPENLHYGIFHHCLDREAFETAQGNININSLKTVSLYSEHAPTFKRVGKVEDVAERESQRLEVQSEILNLPKYLDVLKEVIQGRVEPQDAEFLTGCVLSSKIL